MNTPPFKFSEIVEGSTRVITIFYPDGGNLRIANVEPFEYRKYEGTFGNTEYTICTGCFENPLVAPFDRLPRVTTADEMLIMFPNGFKCTPCNTWVKPNN